MNHVRIAVMAGAMAFGGAAGARPLGFDAPMTPHREGAPPIGAMRSEVLVRVSGGEGPEMLSVIERERHAAVKHISPSVHSADTGLMPSRHLVLPLRSDILMRVNGGDGPDSLKMAMPLRPSDGGDDDPKLSRASSFHLPFRAEIAQHLTHDNPEAVVTTGVHQSAGPSSGTGKSGLSGATLAKINASLSHSLPGWMVAKLRAGARFVEFDDPKIDREGIWAAGRRGQRAAQESTNSQVSQSSQPSQSLQLLK